MKKDEDASDLKRVQHIMSIHSKLQRTPSKDMKVNPGEPFLSHSAMKVRTPGITFDEDEESEEQQIQKAEFVN